MSKFEHNVVKQKLQDFLIYDEFEHFRNKQSENFQSIENVIAEVKDDVSGTFLKRDLIIIEYKSMISHMIQSQLETVTATLEDNINRIIGDTWVTQDIVDKIYDKINTKADKFTWELTLKTFIKQIEIFNVILVEKLRMELENIDENKQTLRAQQLNLLKHTFSLQKWIASTKENSFIVPHRSASQWLIKEKNSPRTPKSLNRTPKDLLKMK